jgi:hypothetical protein
MTAVFPSAPTNGTVPERVRSFGIKRRQPPEYSDGWQRFLKKRKEKKRGIH